MHPYFQALITEGNARRARRKAIGHALAIIGLALFVGLGFTLPLWCPLEWITR